MGLANLDWPTAEDVDMMGVMELRRMYRFLRLPENETELAILNLIGERLQANGLMTLPPRKNDGFDLPDADRRGE
jgi:hypothetical protein